MVRLFRSPLAALVLLLASPGLAGVALDSAHPCPAKAPWLAQHGGGHHGDTGHQHSGVPSQHDCKCFGSSLHAPQVAPVNAAAVLALAPLVATGVVRPHHSAFIPVGHPAGLLPPATAPPLV